ncbi:MAG: 2-C-methyl-D-erythritol 4-phosphate cytidylyltransferase [Solirubrobacterales bacterium]
MDGEMTASAVIVAAGSGERLGAGGSKALVEVAGRPLYEWSVVAAEDASRIGEIVVAVPPGEEQFFERAGVRVVPGGSARSESVAAALEAVSTDLVAVHDAARPLVTPEHFDVAVSLLAGNPELDGAIVAAPVSATVKQVDSGGQIEGTLDRDCLRLAETPQVFRTASLREAIAAGDLGAATDDAYLVERNGGKVAVVELPLPNPKVTYPGDIELVEALFERARGRVPEWKVSGC